VKGLAEIKVGVVGVGALGRHHARVLSELPDVRLVGVLDADAARAEEAAARHRCRAFGDLAGLLAEVDAVSVVVPTVAHHTVASACLDAGRDVLVEKPIAATLAEADDLIARAERGGRILQVGHVERFNPAVDLLLREGKGARFVEVHRLGAFPARSLDIDVVLDLMIHDIDLVMALDGSEPLQVDAVGVPVLTPRVDIANARLRLASGLIANLTASRVSRERVRKFRVFAPGAYVSADLATRVSRVHRLITTDDGLPELREEGGSNGTEEPLCRELAAFIRSVGERSTPVVSGADGRRALALAITILERIGDIPKP